MIKRFVTALVITLGVLFGALFLHDYLAKANDWHIEFYLHPVYYFFAIGAIFTYAIVELAYRFAPDKIAYAFLISVMVKLGCFMIIFMGDFLHIATNSMASRLSIVVPLFLFLAIEAVATYAVVNASPHSSNDQED